MNSTNDTENHEEAMATDNLNFSEALSYIKQGKLMQRSGWNGKGMFVFMVNGSTFQVSRPPLNSIFAEGTAINYRGHIDMKMADGTITVWNPNMPDILADDWQVAQSPIM